MLKLGALVIPVMPVDEVVELIVAAEDVGLDYCLVADESLMTDAYVALAAAARETSAIRLGPVTNGYTRHPAVSAAAIASLNELTGGRALVTLVAGGSMALTPLGLTREKPALVMGETMEVMRRIWSGESVSWGGERFRLEDARLAGGSQEIPVWVAARGPRLLHQAGRAADGVVLEVKADLPAAFELVSQGAAESDRRPDRIYLDRMAYRPETQAGLASEVFVHVLMDSPSRQLRALGFDNDEIVAFRSAYEAHGPEMAATHITREMVRRHQIIGSPADCSLVLRSLTAQLDLDVFLFYISRAGFDDNVRAMRDVQAIVEAARVGQ